MSSSGKRFRRTNAQLEATWVRVEGEKRAEEDRRQVRRESFWKPREAVGQGQPTEEGQVASAEVAAGGGQGPSAVGGADGGQEQAAISSASAATASATNISADSKNSTIQKKPTAEDPLPGVNLSRIPKIFRLRVGLVMEKLRERMKKGKIQSNQHIKHSASGSFPWRDVD
jgi:hypothetical protein